MLDDERALQVIRGTATGPYSDRSEEEFAGYRDAVDYLVEKDPEPLSVPLLLHLHRTLMRHTDDPLAGKLKTVAAGAATERALSELVARYEEALAGARIPSPLLIAALVLDLLAIHPFEEATADGPGTS